MHFCYICRCKRGRLGRGAAFDCRVFPSTFVLVALCCSYRAKAWGTGEATPRGNRRHRPPTFPVTSPLSRHHRPTSVVVVPILQPAPNHLYFVLDYFAPYRLSLAASDLFMIGRSAHSLIPKKRPDAGIQHHLTTRA